MPHNAAVRPDSLRGALLIGRARNTNVVLVGTNGQLFARTMYPNSCIYVPEHHIYVPHSINKTIRWVLVQLRPGDSYF